MASSEPCSSVNQNQTDRDVWGPEARRMIRRITQIETDGLCNSSLMKKGFELVQYYTGFDYKTLHELYNKKIHVTTVIDLDRSSIHNKLMESYLNKQELPTCKDLYSALQDILPPYMDIFQFRRILYKMDFVWKKLNNGLWVIIEKPAVVFERYTYLKKITQFREDNSSIFFVGESVIDEGVLTSRQDKICNDPSKQPIWRILYVISTKGVHFLKYVKGFSSLIIENWMIDDVLPQLPKSSVVVIDNTDNYCRPFIEVPTLRSPKIDMMEWLDKHNIPFSNEMLKIELYYLIRNYTDTQMNTYKLDNIFKYYNHTLLRIPKCINGLTPVIMFHETLKQNFYPNYYGITKGNKSVKKTPMLLDKVFRSMCESFFQEWNDHIANEEKRLKSLDEMVDRVIDELLDKAEKQKSSLSIDENNLDLSIFYDSD